MAKRGRPTKNKEAPPWMPTVEAPMAKPAKEEFQPVVMVYNGLEKIVTTQEHLDVEIARGKWKVKP